MLSNNNLHLCSVDFGAVNLATGCLGVFTVSKLNESESARALAMVVEREIYIGYLSKLAKNSFEFLRRSLEVQMTYKNAV